MTDITLVKDCGLYPSYKKIINFTGTKSQIRQKQKTWLSGFFHTTIQNVNYNKLQNAVTLDIDYSDAQKYSYAMLENIESADPDLIMFCFIDSIENKSSGETTEGQPDHVSFNLLIDPIMSYMGEWEIDECFVNREHKDRWAQVGSKPLRVTPNVEKIDCFMDVESQQTILGTTYGMVIFTYTSDVDASKGYRETSKIRCAVYPIRFDTAEMYGVIRINHDGTYDDLAIKYPNYYDTINARFTTMFALNPEDIISVNIIPIPTNSFNTLFPSKTAKNSDGDTVTAYYFSNGYPIPAMDIADMVQGYKDTVSGFAYYGFKSVQYANFSNTVPEPLFNPSTQPGLIDSGVSFIRMDLDTDSIDYELSSYPMNMLQHIEFNEIKLSFDFTINNWDDLAKPQDEDLASDIYEPALFMSPYRNRKLVNGYGDKILDIPEIIWFANGLYDKTLTISVVSTGFGVTINYKIGNNDFTSSGTIGCATNVNALSLDIVNDKWLQYSLTEKDTDRQIVTNDSIRSAIDSLLFMSYGGALVGSRSAGEEGYFGRTPVKYTQKRSPTGQFQSGYDVSGGNLRLTDTGRRVFGAIGLAGGASIISSVVDAHFAWQNQLQKEQAIRNQPSGLLSIGTSSGLIQMDKINDEFITLKCDDVNYEIAYNNYRQYGYIVNEFEKPNINSRKYYNYLLTGGCIIKGALNGDVRDAIASVFDNGVTIFHYDSNNTQVRKLEYPEYENIEVSLI